jgi:hypothetical protein
MVRNNTALRIGLFCIAFVVSSCGQNYSEFGSHQNNKRRDIGLPVLPENWKVQKAGTDFNGLDYIIWVNPENRTKGKAPIHFSKAIKHNNDRIISESDTFHNGKKYMTIDGESYISMVWKYNYEESIEDGVKFDKGWSIHLYDQRGATKLSTIQADSILETWGLVRN